MVLPSAVNLGVTIGNCFGLIGKVIMVDRMGHLALQDGYGKGGANSFVTSRGRHLKAFLCDLFGVVSVGLSGCFWG